MKISTFQNRLRRFKFQTFNPKFFIIPFASTFDFMLSSSVIQKYKNKKFSFRKVWLYKNKRKLYRFKVYLFIVYLLTIDSNEIFCKFCKVTSTSLSLKFTWEKIGETKNHLDKIHQREHNDCLVFKPKRYNPFRRKVLLEILKKVTSKTSESFEIRL